VTEWNLPVLLQLFTELEFGLLVDKVKIRMPPSEDLVVVPAPEASTAIATVGPAPDTKVTLGAGIGKLVDAIREAKRMAIFVELDPGRFDRAHLVSLAIAVPGHAPAYVPLGHRYIGAPAPPPASDLQPLYAVLADPAIAKVCHDAKQVIRVF